LPAALSPARVQEKPAALLQVIDGRF